MHKMEVGAPTLEANREDMKRNVSARALAAVAELYSEGKLCDVVLRVGGAELTAHKIILCSCSAYFCTLFTRTWATSDQRTYTIPGVSAETMRLVITYAYTHTVPLTEDNVVGVLEAADQLLVPGLVQACCCFLEDQLCLENCIGIWRLASFFHCRAFTCQVFVFILHHFEEIVSVSEEFLELSGLQLAAVIQSDHLNVKGESVVFETVLRWINHMPDSRQAHLSRLLPKVRLDLMSTHYLKKVKRNNLIKNNAECLSIISDALEEATDFICETYQSWIHRGPTSWPRLPPTVLLVTGGHHYNLTAAQTFELYDARTDSWVSMNSAVSVVHHGAVVLDGFVYLIGGYSQGVSLNTVQRFNFITFTWENVASMKYPRCSPSVAVLGGCIYAMGGFLGYFYHDTAERYNPATDRWTMIEPMHDRRSGAGAASLHGKVYVCGGFNGRHSLYAAESYHPETHQWTVITPMRCCRYSLGVVAYKSRIYAVGGCVNWMTDLRSVEAFNPTTNRWQMVPSMCFHRRNFGLEVVEERLFVVGGSNRYGVLSSVERYDEDACAWSHVSHINRPRCNLSCCLLIGHYELAEQLFPRGPQTPEDAEYAELKA